MMSRQKHSDISAAVTDAHTIASRAKGGANANYIPYLAAVDPKLCGVAVATVDGSIHVAGDSEVEFALESISKVFTLALAMKQVRPEVIRSKIGDAATDLPFNSVMALELHHDLPVSPLVNAGALSTVSLIPASGTEERWNQILNIQGAFAAKDIVLDPQLNSSEQRTNFHNRAIAWLLYSAGSLYAEPMSVCDVYTRQCSTLVTVRDLAVMGATLANGGVNPVSGAQVLTADNVPHVLADMTMEGLYTASGDWAYNVGLPAKSGVGGGIVAVAPGRLAIAAFSPPLDGAGNSVRGQIAVAHVAKKLKLNLYRMPAQS